MNSLIERWECFCIEKRSINKFKWYRWNQRNCRHVPVMFPKLVCNWPQKLKFEWPRDHAMQRFNNGIVELRNRVILMNIKHKKLSRNLIHSCSCHRRMAKEWSIIWSFVGVTAKQWDFLLIQLEDWEQYPLYCQEFWSQCTFDFRHQTKIEVCKMISLVSGACCFKSSWFAVTGSKNQMLGTVSTVVDPIPLCICISWLEGPLLWKIDWMSNL